MKVPSWFDWSTWGLAIGSNRRYEPRWYERRAYVMGLRDASRIVESQRFSEDYARDTHGEPELRARRQMGREVIQLIHAYALRVLGLPPEAQRMIEKLRKFWAYLFCGPERRHWRAMGVGDDCPICGPHPFPGIRDEGCFDPRYNCPRTSIRYPSAGDVGGY